MEKTVYPTYGHKARIGGIFPSRTAETTIYQFFRILPPGSGVTWAGISLGTEALTLSELDRVRDGIVDAAVVLANSKVNIVVQCGVPVVVCNSLLLTQAPRQRRSIRYRDSRETVKRNASSRRSSTEF